MNIAHFISSIDNDTGGPARSVTHLIAMLLTFNTCKVSLFTAKTENPIIEKFEKSEGNILFCNTKKLGRLALKTSDFNNINLFHGHGLWQAPVHQMATYAKNNNIPYIITPRGMLEPWSLTQSSLKKKIAFLLFQRKDLEQAACIHATAQMEVDNIRKLGYKNPIALIPNGVNLDSYPEKAPKKNTLNKKILFLSRIHKKKGIEHLIEAWGGIEESVREGWLIEIVGNGEEKYIIDLKNSISENKLEDQIKIKSPVFGKKKVDLFREANLFVLPTYSENFGIVIAEALASYTPVITTIGTPWKDIQSNHCGWWIGLGTQNLKRALVEALNTDEATMATMGKNGRKLIQDNYSMISISQKMIELYDWLINKKTMPNFVNICKK